MTQAIEIWFHTCVNLCRVTSERRAGVASEIADPQVNSLFREMVTISCQKLTMVFCCRSVAVFVGYVDRSWQSL
jgi:hypothetical protein